MQLKYMFKHWNIYVLKYLIPKAFYLKIQIFPNLYMLNVWNEPNKSIGAFCRFYFKSEGSPTYSDNGKII